VITLLFGPPGSGKGTQAAQIAQSQNVPHISTGDIFRAHLKAGTPLGVRVKSIIDSGALVSDELTCELVKDRLSQPDCVGGALLDGFPRSTPQAEWLFGTYKGQHPFQAVNLVVPEAVLLPRLGGRRVCKSCGSGYHIDQNLPAQCTRCGGDIIRRADDSDEAVKERLAVYERSTAPVLEYLIANCTVHHVDGVGSVEAVGGRIATALK